MQQNWFHGFVVVLATVTTACQNTPEPAPAKPETVTQSAKPASPSAEAPSNTAPSSAPSTTEAPAAAPGSDQAAELKAGDPAPPVKLTMQDGKVVDLASLKGKQVALYFYPKDDTPGCTVEAQGIRDQWAQFEKAGIEVFGVSRQDAASHAAFIEKHKLPFDLVVDDGSVTKAFGVPVKDDEYAARHTFLIGPDGNIKQVWRSVNPSEHASEILQAAGVSAEPAEPAEAPKAG